MPSWTLRNLHCDVNVFVSSVTRSGQFKQVCADARITNDNYSVINLFRIFHILNIRPLDLLLIKKNQHLHSQFAISRGGLVLNKANCIVLSTQSVVAMLCSVVQL